MRLIEVPSSQLKPGMFVAELDRPWLETPFAIQGFVIRDQADVRYVSQYIDYAYVDLNYKGSKVFLSGSSGGPQPASSRGLAIKADFDQAKITFESTQESLDKVFDAIGKGETANIETVKEAVKPLINSVFKNQEAVAILLRFKEENDYRYHHSIAMAVWATILGRHIGLSRDELEKLAIGCTLCDAGMLNLPRTFLDNPNKFDQKQRDIILKHPEISAEIVGSSGAVDLEILAIIESHHERHNGSGYPQGLTGTGIPLLARIAGLADTYDAMITSRPHAKAHCSYDAMQELIDTKGELFQAPLVEQFIQAIGLFPTGSIVELNSGEVAIVVNQNSSRRLKPEVVVILDKNKQQKSPFDLIDLSQTSLTGADACWIVRELEPGAYGINPEDYFI